ncbi:ubiquinone biosynthesis accessory factor UbiJ [Undibacterium sp. Ren11W]|uniref:ubiquinone biosynthesis accessory factor UbiJ n=1 Tax=Undibacterium sp. Ren11W TaxID=3413045 RepID=UPI003BF1232D
MIPLSPPFALFVNHLLAQESWARSKLQKHAGKVACIDLQMFSLRLQITGDGMLQAAAGEAAPDVTIRLKAADLPLIAQHREHAFSYVKIEGDADFANSISHLSQHLRWEAEEDLSKLFGDVAAVRIVTSAKSLLDTVKQTHQNIQENLAEYFLEEQPMLVRPAAVQAFGSEVNKIRDDVERLMKRVAKLERLS